MNPEKTGEFLSALVRQGAVVAREMDDDRGQHFIEGDGQRELLRVLRQGLVLVPPTKTIADEAVASATKVRTRVFSIRRAAGPLEDRVKKGFNYGDPNLTLENFRKQVPAGSPDEAVAVNFGEWVESDDAVARLDAMSLRSGLPGELADLSETHPNSAELAECLPMNALGDFWQDVRRRRRVACLFGDASGRKLRLDVWRRGWVVDWWFLAFPK